jgi:hypothetical protein
LKIFPAELLGGERRDVVPDAVELIPGVFRVIEQLAAQDPFRPVVEYLHDIALAEFHAEQALGQPRLIVVAGEITELILVPGTAGLGFAFLLLALGHRTSV